VPPAFSIGAMGFNEALENVLLEKQAAGNKFGVTERQREQLSRARQARSAVRQPTVAEATRLAAGSPMLAGAPLQLPRFHPVAWVAGQSFSESEDPDRTCGAAARAWSTPRFIATSDPVARAAATTVTEIRLPPSRSADGSFARGVHGVLTECECAAVLKAVNDKGFTPVLLNSGYGRQRLVPSVRDGHRMVTDDPTFARWLLEVLRPHLPATHNTGGNQRELFGLNERCRFLLYTPGQHFAPHQDGRYTRPEGHLDAGAYSRVTVQLYLNDVPDNHGGATTFFVSEDGHRREVPFQPKAGAVLLFTQDLLHEGSRLDAGLKYAMRTEAMYGCRNR